MIIIVYQPSESFILKSVGGSGFWLLFIVIIVFIYYYSFNVCVTSPVSVQLRLTTTCALALASLAPVTRSGTRRLDVSPARLTSLSQACLRCTAATVLTVRTTDTPRTTLETADITLSQLRLTVASGG